MTDQIMRADRSIAAGPRRGTEQACVDIAEFVTDLLRARSYPETAKARSRLEVVFPVLRYLLTTRGLANPAVRVMTPGLQVEISVSYEPRFEEDLTPPNLVLLQDLSADDVVEISIRSSAQLDGSLAALPGRASTKTIHFTVEQPAAEENPEAVADAVAAETDENDRAAGQQDDDRAKPSPDEEAVTSDSAPDNRKLESSSD